MFDRFDIININGAPVMKTENPYTKNINMSSELDMILSNPNLDPNYIRRSMPYIYNIILDRIYETDAGLTDKLNNFVLTKELCDYMAMLYSKNRAYATDNYSIKINKMVFDFLTSTQINIRTKMCSDELFKLLRLYNQDQVNALQVTNLPEELLQYTIMVSRSSLKQYINIKRLNYIIMSCCSFYGMVVPISPQQIADLYYGLFRHMSELLTYTMLDPYSQKTLAEISDEASEVYSNQNLAIVEMLNKMDERSIEQVLIIYALTYQQRKTAKNFRGVRFSMKSNSQYEYARIYTVMDRLEAQGYFIP